MSSEVKITILSYNAIVLLRNVYKTFVDTFTNIATLLVCNYQLSSVTFTKSINNQQLVAENR